MTSADLCRANGWGVGTVLEGEETWPNGQVVTDRIRITAVGEACVLAKMVAHKEGGSPWVGVDNGRETTWTLTYRTWRPVPQSVAPATVRVRIAVAVATEGFWAACGRNTPHRQDSPPDDEWMARQDLRMPEVSIFWVVADVPKPRAAEVRGTVEDKI